MQEGVGIVNHGVEFNSGTGVSAFCGVPDEGAVHLICLLFDLL